MGRRGKGAARAERARRYFILSHLPLLRVLCLLSVCFVCYSDLPALSCVDAQLKAAKVDADKLKADATKLEGIVSAMFG